MKLSQFGPLALVAGVKTNFPLVMSATLTNWPDATGEPLSARCPLAGRVVIFTAKSELDGVSLGSLNPKSAAANAYPVSSSVVSVLLAPAGAWLIGGVMTIESLCKSTWLGSTWATGNTATG